MPATHTLHIVTGAPGSGKSTALAALLQLNSGYIAFDIDWLASAASQLAGADIRSEPATWKPYNALWLEILRAIHGNGSVPVLFAPLDKRDLPQHEWPTWCEAIEWLLLDCDDLLRRQRLLQRPGWTDALVADALSDARFLRETIPQRLDTGAMPPDRIADTILRWLEGTA